MTFLTAKFLRKCKGNVWRRFRCPEAAECWTSSPCVKGEQRLNTKRIASDGYNETRGQHKVVATSHSTRSLTNSIGWLYKVPNLANYCASKSTNLSTVRNTDGLDRQRQRQQWHQL